MRKASLHHSLKAGGVIRLVGKLFSALCAAAGKHLSAVFGCHSFSEAVLHLSVPLFGLKCSFHLIHYLSKIYDRCAVRRFISIKRTILYIINNGVVNQKIIILVIIKIIYYNNTIFCAEGRSEQQEAALRERNVCYDRYHRRYGYRDRGGCRRHRGPCF